MVREWCSMKKVIIVSEDIYIIKSIINVTKDYNISIIDINELEEKLTDNYSSLENSIYFIDIVNYEYKVNEIVEKIKNSKIILITLNDNHNYLLKSTFNVFKQINKNIDFAKNITKLWHELQTNESQEICITDGIIIDQSDLKKIYTWPNNKYTINLTTKNENLFITFENPNKEFKKIINNTFYQEVNLKKKERQSYPSMFKQIVVDLYLKYHIDYKLLGKYLSVNPNNIKSWASSVKYQRKTSIIEYFIIKIIIHKYKKIYKKRGDRL